ncbi:MAG: hypothetical protein ABR564_08340, partial [Candidatus Dormibacteria bacterium]
QGGPALHGGPAAQGGPALHGGPAAQAGPALKAEPSPALRAGAFLVMALAVVSAIGAKFANAIATREDSASYARDFPVCATRWLARAPSGLKIFNQYGEGGYLAYRLSSRGDRVYIFGDAALMGDELLLDYGDIESLKPRWDQLIRRSGANLVLFDAGTPLATVLEASSRWTKVYSDELNVAFVPVGRVPALALPDAPAGAGRSSDGCASTSVQGHR